MAIINKIKLTEIENFRDLSPDFYKPDFMKKSATIRANNFRRLGQISYVTDGEHGSPCWSDSSGIKYVTAEFIKENFIEEGITKQITVEQDRRNARARLREGDILVYSVGAYAGLTCVAEPHLFPANIPRSVAIIRLNQSHELLPEFVSVFLNSNAGKFQAIRFRAGNSQPVLALEKIRQFEVPLVDINKQIEIKNLYQQAYQNRLKSQYLYKQATDLLEQELGLDKIEFQKAKSFKAKFSEVATSIRLDSGHYQPKFEQLIVHLKNNFETRKISHLVSCNRRGLQPSYDPQGQIDVINSKHLTTTHLKYDEFEKTTLAAFKTSLVAQIQKGDILIYTTGAYVGLTNVYLSDKSALASNHVNILRIKDSEIDSAYIALILNTTVGKFQTEQHIRGSAQAELYPNDIAKFIVPLLSKTIMQKIGNLVRDSLLFSQQSKELLTKAKRRVEQLIVETANN